MLAVPVVGFSAMTGMLLGYTPPAWSAWVPPVLGTVILFWPGWPFLSGAVAEIRARRPGMMLLIGMAVGVAWVASLLSSLGVGGLDFWWELALLVVIMLLGHWLEMRALGQASEPSTHWPRCCPTPPSGSRPTARSARSHRPT